MKDFAAKTVVVTGAASGIGREIALAFARRGARLAVGDINEAGLQEVRKELEGLGAEPHVSTVDVSDAERVAEWCDEVYTVLGRVDVLCNNAGIGMGGRFEDVTMEDWKWIVGVNLWGVVHGCHFFYPRMIAQGGGGHIVNTASGAGLAPLPLMTAYCCTKYAVVGLSETLRAEAALHGIGVSAICPGIVDTPITRSAKLCSGTDRSTPQELQERIVRIYGRRGYTPDRVAAAVVKAVERNRGVVPVCPETYVGDWLHRASRKLNDINLARSVKMFLKYL
ncbi:MAG: SDR family NAD(P)-dependent oxidoreductase [Actinobacteria bacterium]|jgi:NAD(P)-dependent dehydrogenase (short-subunit alcohol dehydrogenase family)|nr:MAG: SDR family NAD(P)-dependent oxidoreductase [Actinomycetota bacterium]